MEDKIDEFFEIIGNKKTLIIALVAWIIVMAAVLVIIWMPKEKKYATYQKVDLNNKKTELAREYLSTLSLMLKEANTFEFERKLSKSYLAYTNKTSEEVVAELEKTGFFSKDTTLTNMTLYEDGNTYIFSSIMRSGNNERTINIIEQSPYVYNIVLDNFYLYSDAEKLTKSNNIEFKVKNVYNNLKYIEINMSIENLNDTYARFDFGSTTGVQAVLEDGTIISLANLVASEIYTNVEPNMTLNKNFVFEIPIQLQSGIQCILFNDVTLEFSKTDIQVVIN